MQENDSMGTVVRDNPKSMGERTGMKSFLQSDRFQTSVRKGVSFTENKAEVHQYEQYEDNQAQDMPEEPIGNV